MTRTQYNQSVAEFADGLFLYAVKLIRDRTASEDIVQDVFEKVWKRRASIHADEVKRYLFKAVYNTCMDRLRKMKSARKYEAYAGDSHHTQEENKFEFQDALHRALEQLAEDQKALILLRDYEGYSYDEIGDITGLSLSQVKVYLFRARKSLREIVQNLYSEPLIQ